MSTPADANAPAPPLHVVVHGAGPNVLLVHGSAADHTTWVNQLIALRSRLRLIAPDRRGCGASQLPEGKPFLTFDEHAAELAEVIQTHAGGGPVVACGSSLGAILVLELARRRPELLRGIALIEPPLPPTTGAPAVPPDFLARFDQLTADEGGEMAAEYFLRTVLGDGVFERLPLSIQRRTKAGWRSIRRDLGGLSSYPVDYAAFGTITAPALLFGGDRSLPLYRPALEALHRALKGSQLEIVPGGGHMLHAEVYSRFNARLAAFVEELFQVPAKSD